MVYDERSLDSTFAALADPTRRAILARLASGDRTISDLASRFAMSLPAVSKHVRVLERAGLASVRREGRVRRTTLIAAPMRDAAAWMERYRQFWEFQFDQLASYLATTTDGQSEDSPWPERQRQKQRARSKSAARSPSPETGSSERGQRRKS